MKSLALVRRRHLLLLGGFVLLGLGAAELNSTLPTQQSLEKAMNDGNHRDALGGFRQRVESPTTNAEEVARDLSLAVSCLNHLNEYSQFDELLESAVETHSDNWKLLAEAARLYSNGPHYGYQISGEFQRGPHRGGGKVMHATERDRVRALQLTKQALDAAIETGDNSQAAEVAHQLATTLLAGSQGGWGLGRLTDLETLPEYEEGWGPGGHSGGAPVNAENSPIYYDMPESWQAAANDGQRWRWALAEMSRLAPKRHIDELTQRANFLRGQFGVPTLRGIIEPLLAKAEEPNAKTSVYSLHTLTEDETLARLATGIQRFKLPDEHNFVKLYQQALAEAEQEGLTGRAWEVASQLAQLFADRRQYPRASEYWHIALEHASGNWQKDQANSQIAQIEKPWGQFEPARTQPRETGASFEFRYRNGERVDFVAEEIDVAQLLADVKAYIKSKPREFDYNKLQLDRIGYRLVHENQQKYIGGEVARWTTPLESPPGHFDRRTTITTPLQKAGAYLVTANMKGGNTAKIVLWVADTAILKKSMGNRTLYYVADASTGKPIEKANVELFGYRYERTKPDEMTVDIEQFAEFTNADGQVTVNLAEDDQPQNYQWLTVATTPEGRLAYLGFHRVWRQSPRVGGPPERVETFAITDRPVYRPSQKVKLKLWVENVKYDAAEESPFAHKTFQLEVHDPKGEKVVSQQVTANAYGGVSAEYELPSGATLGQYRFHLVNYGGGNFRVEEYKKPEFEVTVDAPNEPLALGEQFDATITARYYFGEPVREGTVKYKVTRTTRDQQWFPTGRWDWLYGNGYWWFGYDYDWYPGWRRWGCFSPYPWWVYRQPQPPEIVAEGEAELDENGKLKIRIDSSLAKEIHPDHDHQYQIQAEVVDRSRRTIVGTGTVIAARKPFEVFAWTDRGYYRTGDTVTANFQARRPDGKPVTGSGKLRLLSISYPDGFDSTPRETEVRAWELDTNSEGKSELQIKASEPGQYRLSYELTATTSDPDTKNQKADNEADEPSQTPEKTTPKKTIEGGYFFTIVGESFDGNDFRFADLEIVPDKRHYAPGEKLKLQINTNRRGGVVLLFVRPESNVYAPPQLVRLDGKSTTVEIDIAQGDMPNFFVEAQTVSAGRVHTVAKQIVVPPAKRVINVEVAPSSTAYQPGGEATVKIRLTDEEGAPIVGDTVLSVYDKSLEYISGGSNVGDIRKAFWSWRRHHSPQTEHNLDRYTSNLTPKGQTAMSWLGAFGHLADIDDTRKQRGLRSDTGVFQRGPRGGVTATRAMAMPAAAGLSMRESSPLADSSMATDSLDMAAEMEESGPAPAEVVPTVRKDFADSAYWSASVETDPTGLAEVKFPMPENLTNWTFKVWSLGHGVRVGDGSAEAVTRKNLLVRLQTPRFLVERDEVVISANVHNYLPESKQVRVRLELDDDYLASITEGDSLESVVEIEANGEQRVDWRLKANREGLATLRALAITDQESDAMQLEVPVKVHGIQKLIPHSGVIALDANKAAFEVTVPEQRRVNSTRLEVQFSPTLAGAMVDALPYLIDYPYGCTEQTLNRFLPAVLTQQTLQRMGVDLQAIRDKQTNLNPQELGDAKERAEQWQLEKQKRGMESNPVFDEAELDKVVKAGVNRLTEMQLSDGGWGWFSGFGEHSSPHTTATVVRGLLVAKDNDVAIVPNVVERGVEWLARYQESELEKLNNRDADGNRIDKDKPYKRFADNLDALVYLVLAEANSADVKSAPASQMTSTRKAIYNDRTKLAVYSLATFGLALQREIDAGGEQPQVDMRDKVLENLSQYVVEDNENQTAYLNLPAGNWWYWYGSEYEAHAYYLKLLAANDPQSDVAAGLVKYLLNNRKHATYWNSTRDTALVVEAMSDYLQATGEGNNEMTVEVWLNGQRQKTVEITPEVLFSYDNRFVIEGADIAAGRHTVELRKQGAGRLYFNAYLSVFSLEDDIKGAGLELKVRRKYFKLTPVEATKDVAGGRGQVVNQKVEKYERQEIPNLGQVNSGDLIEIELTVESKNDYEYILLEDLKAAGFEPVEVRSGYNGNELNAYMELRDDRVSLFVQRLARGTHSVSYRMRAETPGKFSALPTTAYAMYAPELKGTADELKVSIEDE